MINVTIKAQIETLLSDGAPETARWSMDGAQRIVFVKAAGLERIPDSRLVAAMRGLAHPLVSAASRVRGARARATMEAALRKIVEIHHGLPDGAGLLASFDAMCTVARIALAQDDDYSIALRTGSEARVAPCCEAMRVAVADRTIQTFVFYGQSPTLDRAGYFANPRRPRRPKGMPRAEWTPPPDPAIYWAAFLTRHLPAPCEHDVDEWQPQSATRLAVCPFCAAPVVIAQSEPLHFPFPAARSEWLAGLRSLLAVPEW